MKSCDSRAVSQSCRRMTWYSPCTPPSLHFSLFHKVLLCDHWFRITQSEFKLQLKNFSFLMLLLQCTCRELFIHQGTCWALENPPLLAVSWELGQQRVVARIRLVEIVGVFLLEQISVHSPRNLLHS